MLLAASCYFYMSFIPVYILILFLLIVIDYVAGIMIEGASEGRRKLYLAASVFSNVFILAFFKYYNFFNENIGALLQFFNFQNPMNSLDIILPIGLSFHTFQAMSYTIEVYRGAQKAERHFGIYALYVMFYPQLVAGPIERPQNLIHQFHEKHEFDYQRVTDGIKLMAWGMFKKTVIADRAALLVEQVYSNPSGFEGIHFIIATVFFAFQIYCDFSAYSDIAIGSASVMGFKLMQNFNRPYYSKNISEFWKRWHISLSTWLKDYLYVALGGDTVVRWKLFTSLFITFLFSGIWHGANWTFVVWGAINGIYIIFSYILRNFKRKMLKKTGLVNHPFLHKCVQVVTTFSLVCFAWIFFRAGNMHDAFYIVTHLGSGLPAFFYNIGDIARVKTTLKGMGLEQSEFLIAAGAIVIMECIHLIQRRYRIRAIIGRLPVAARWGIYYAVFFIILKFGVFEEQEFIYFQF